MAKKSVCCPIFCFHVVVIYCHPIALGAGLGLGVNLLNAMLTLDLESECLVLSAMQLQLIVSCEPELNKALRSLPSTWAGRQKWDFAHTVVFPPKNVRTVSYSYLRIKNHAKN